MMSNQQWKWRSRPPFPVSRPGPLWRHGAEPPARRGRLRETDPGQPGRPRPEAPGRRRVPRALRHLPVGRREGGVKHSSSSSSSHKKKKSSSSSGEAKRRSRDRSPIRSPTPASLPGTPRESRSEAPGPLPSPPRVTRTPVPLTPMALGAIPVDPRTPVSPASRPALGPGTPAGASLPALSLPHQWQMQLYQLQAMQQAMASVPYTFPGQQPFQPPGFGAGDAFGPSSVSQSSAPAPPAAQAIQPSQSTDPGRDTPSDISHEEWELIKRLRQGGGGG